MNAFETRAQLARDYVNDELARMLNEHDLYTSAQVTDALVNVARLLNGDSLDKPEVLTAAYSARPFDEPASDARLAAALATRKLERAGMTSGNPYTEFGLGYTRGSAEATAVYVELEELWRRGRISDIGLRHRVLQENKRHRPALPWSDPKSDPVGDLRAMYPMLVRATNEEQSDE